MLTKLRLRSQTPASNQSQITAPRFFGIGALLVDNGQLTIVVSLRDDFMIKGNKNHCHREARSAVAISRYKVRFLKHFQ